MTPDRRAQERQERLEERLAKLLQEFQDGQERQATAIAKLKAAMDDARQGIAEARRLHQEAVEVTTELQRRLTRYTRKRKT